MLVNSKIQKKMNRQQYKSFLKDVAARWDLIQHMQVVREHKYLYFVTVSYWMHEVEPDVMQTAVANARKEWVS